MDEDLQLIQSVLRGEQAAFQHLVERYQDYVFTITFKVLRKHEVAEEVAQDVFIKVYRMLGSFEQRSRFSTWLYTIAYRAALDEARKKKRHTTSIEAEDNYLQIEDTDTAAPDQDLLQGDLATQLKQAMDRLKPLDANLISLFYLQERSIPEIAEITGLSVSNIKTKLHRLREQLRKKLRQQLQSETKDLLSK
jgi:RNA polymerase sigma-70 factor (ECF subfamily)